MKVLFISSANSGIISPIVISQGKSLQNSGISVSYFGIYGKGIKGYLSNIPQIRKKVKEYNPDFIHAHYSLSGIIVALCVTNKPVIVSLMGSDIQAGFIFKNAIKLFSTLFWKAVIVKSDKMKATIRLGNAHVIPNGVDLKCFKPLRDSGFKKKIGFKEQNINILFLADPKRMEKNHKLAADAMKFVKTKNAKLNVCYNLTHSDIPKVINASDIILMTSKWEGSPNVIKEAMACNRPIVSTDVGDVKWLLGNEAGHFIAGYQPKDVAINIDKACFFHTNVGNTSGRKRINEIGLDNCTIADKLQSLYRSILANN